MLYLSLISRKTVNGDRVHVDAMSARFPGLCLNTRNLAIILRLLRTHEDIVIRDHPFLVIFFLFRNFTKKNIVLEINGSVYDELAQRSKLIAILFLVLHKNYLKKFAKIYFVSEGIKLRFLSLDYKLPNVKVIPNGSDTDLFFRRNKINSKIIIGYVGKKTTWQSLDNSISRLSTKLRELNKHALLLISPNCCVEENYDNIEIVNLHEGNRNTVNFVYSVIDYMLVPDNRFFGDHLLSSPIKFHMAVCNGITPIVFRHSSSVMMDELGLPGCCCLDCTSFDKNDVMKFSQPRTWDMVCDEVLDFLNVSM